MAASAQDSLARGSVNQALMESKLVCGRFYFEKVLPETAALAADIRSGKDSIMALDDEHWGL
jgi:hypothetical protein